MGVHACVRAHVCVYVHTCMYVCVCVCMHLHMLVCLCMSGLEKRYDRRREVLKKILNVKMTFKL